MSLDGERGHVDPAGGVTLQAVAGGEVGQDRLGDEAADRVRGAPAEEALSGGIPVHDEVVRIDGDKRVVGALDDRARLLLAGGERAVGGAQVQLGHDVVGQLGEDLDLDVGPLAGAVLDGAEGAQRVAVSVGQGNAAVGDDVEVLDRRVVLDARVEAGVGHHQRGVAGDDVLAEGVRQRRLVHGHAHRALEVLARVVDERHRRHRRPEQPRGQAGEPIEDRLGL